VSVPSVAVKLAQRALGDLSSRLVLVVGAGETAVLTARALASRGVEPAFIANRRYDRAIGLAQRFGGRAIRFEALPEQMERADIVVASTASPHHVIEREELGEVMRARQGRPVLLIDLAVPRDIDPDCRDLDGVSLHDMDDLQTLVERNASGREAEARKVESILRAELARFERWQGSQDVVPTVAALRARADEIVSRVLIENEPRWESLTDSDRDRIRAMARAIAGRLLHEPTVRLKRASGDDDAYRLVSALRELFGLDAETAPAGEAGGEVRPLRQARARKRPTS
jgi:glutamyl-tRNA reductase